MTTKRTAADAATRIESAPASVSTRTTPASELCEVAAAIVAKRRELGVDAKPKELRRIGEIPVKSDGSLPATNEKFAAIRHQADSYRKSERHWRLKDAWQDFVEARGERYADSQFANYECRCDAQTKALATVRDYCERMRDFVRDGSGLVLFGPAGTGKDHLQVAAIRCAFKQGYVVKWINGMDLFGQFRDAIDSCESEARIIDRYLNPDILAVSDPLSPFGALTDFQSSMLFRIVDARYSHLRPTWATVNIKDGQEGAERMGAQILDRLKHDAVCVSCNWESYRKPAALDVTDGRE